MKRHRFARELTGIFSTGALTLSLSGCQSHLTPYVRLVDESIVYSGPITDSGRKQLIDLLNRTGHKHFFISSGGGSSEAGLEIGQFVSENNVSVTAFGSCLSACANYVFLPSKNRRATIDAQIGLHGGYQSYQSQWLKLLSALPMEFKHEYQSAILSGNRKVEQEIRLLSSAGIDPRIITKSAELTLVGNATFTSIKDGNETTFSTPSIKNSDYELWFPPAHEYLAWGLSIEIAPTPKFSHLAIRTVRASTSISRERTQP